MNQLGTSLRTDDPDGVIFADTFAEGQKFLRFANLAYDTEDRATRFVVMQPSGRCYRTSGQLDDGDWLEAVRVDQTGDTQHQGSMSNSEKREARLAFVYADTFLLEMERLMNLVTPLGWTDIQKEAAIASFAITLLDMDEPTALVVANQIRTEYEVTGHTTTNVGSNALSVFAIGTYINLDAPQKLENGKTVDRWRIYCPSTSVGAPFTLTMKLFKRVSSGVFDVVRSEVVTHSGAAEGYEMVRCLPFEIPATGDYYMGYYNDQVRSLATRSAVNDPYAFTASDVPLGLSQAIPELVGSKPVMGVRYELMYPLVSELGTSKIKGQYRQFAGIETTQF